MQVILYEDANGNIFSSTTMTLSEEGAAPTAPVDSNAGGDSDEVSEEVDVIDVQANVADYGSRPSSSREEAPAITTAPVYEAPPAPSDEATQPPTDSREDSTEQPSYSPPSGGAGSGKGITYTPYTDAGQCKTADDINSDFDKMAGYSLVRLYGIDCGQLDTVVDAAKQRNMKLFLGIPKDKANAGAVGGEIEKIKTALGDDWSVIDTIAVGNEYVNDRDSALVADVVAAVGAAKSALAGTSYKGPVVAPDTQVAFFRETNKALCEASDYLAVNIHAFFNGAIPATGAGEFVVREVNNVKNACPGKNVVVTETGWPNGGGDKGAAISGPEQQKEAIDSIRKHCDEAGIAYYLFSAFNEGWKQEDPNGSTLGCEKFWGILS